MKKAYKAKRKAKAPRRRRAVGPPRAGLQLKSYNYQFKLPSQVLVGTGGASPIMGIQTVNGSGVLPVTNGNINFLGSTNGLPFMFDMALACSFALEDINNHATFVAMYDAYKIRKITLELEFLSNSAATNGYGLMPTSNMVWDQDDAVIPPSITSISGKQGVKRRQFGNGSKTVQRFSFKPCILQDVQTTQGGQAAVVSPSRWLDCTGPDVRHNAFKMYISDIYLPANLTVATAFRFNWTYDVSFRSPLLAS